jgi:hypothetical protein
MDDTMVRLLIVLAGTLVVVATAAVLKARGRRPVRAVPGSGLAPGIYLFSSGDCGECSAARTRLDRLVGSDGYRELVWETSPDQFERLRITEVPSTLVVAADGSAEWHSGVPPGIAKPGNP